MTDLREEFERVIADFNDQLGDLAPAVHAALDAAPEDGKGSAFVTVNLTLDSGWGIRLSFPSANPVLAVLAANAALNALAKNGIVRPPYVSPGATTPEAAPKPASVNQSANAMVQEAVAHGGSVIPQPVTVNTKNGPRVAYPCSYVEHAGAIQSGRNAGKAKFRVSLNGTDAMPYIFTGFHTESLVEAAPDDFLLPMQEGQVAVLNGTVYAVTNEGPDGQRFDAKGGPTKYLNVWYFIPAEKATGE